MDQLVAEIAAYQERAQLTDQQMADELNVPRSSWSVWKNHLASPGLGFAVKAVQVQRFRKAATRALGLPA